MYICRKCERRFVNGEEGWTSVTIDNMSNFANELEEIIKIGRANALSDATYFTKLFLRLNAEQKQALRSMAIDHSVKNSQPNLNEFLVFLSKLPDLSF